MNDDSSKMTREAFLAMVHNIKAQARANVKSAALIAANLNRALDRLAVRDPELASLLKQGIAERGRQSQRVLDYITSRCEQGDK